MRCFYSPLMSTSSPYELHLALAELNLPVHGHGAESALCINTHFLTGE
jgi:hypothetical protein